MVEINCITDDYGNEYLPYYADTVLFKDSDGTTLTKRQEQLIMLYNAIERSENYWHHNKPTAFGNPDHARAQGIVTGMIAGLGWSYQEVNGWIVIKNKTRTIIKIKKPKKPDAYYNTRKEISEILESIGL